MCLDSIFMNFYFLILISGLLQISYGANTTPSCPSPFESVQVPEDTAVGNVVFTLHCNDADTGADGSLTYIISSGNIGRKFNLLQTGTDADIKIAGALDYDDPNTPDSYNLLININDGGSPPLTTSVTVIVTVTPVNEFDPKFLSLPPSIEIPEDTPVGTMIIDPRPFDEDLDHKRMTQATKSLITSPSSPGFFHMDEITGKIYLRQPVDFESSDLHPIVLQIMDEGQTPQRSAQFYLNITVHNVNEHAPICQSEVYNIKIKEDTPAGTAILKLDCSDIESPHLIYALYKGDDRKFKMEDHGDLTLLERIDTDKEENFWTLQIEIRDRGIPRLDTYVSVNVFVEDVDDNIPIWHPANNGSYTASIPENCDVGTVVTFLSALDYDKPGTPHSQVTYAIEGMTSQFTIEHNTGKIIVATPLLDREDKGDYSLSVSAYSSSLMSNKIIGTVAIEITDVNDNYPIFTQEVYSVSWPEDTPVNTAMLKVQARDNDAGKNGKIWYTISDGNTEDGCRMSIDKNSGRITTDSQLDFERKESCFLTIVASDSGSIPLVTTASVIISVTGVNEHKPTFIKQSYSVSVPEDISVGSSIITVEARDDDNGEDGAVIYTIVKHADTFTIDERDGVVRLKTPLDSETTGSYLIEIIAVDQTNGVKQTGTTTLTLVVEDTNEMAPSCQSVAGVRLSSTSIVGDLVYKVDCLDKDIGPNGDLSFSITKGNTNSDFSVDSKGILVLSKLPSNPSYTLEITVSDQGTPPLQTIVNVYVDVVGDPKFSNLPETVQVHENQQPGFVIFTVKVNVSPNSRHFVLKSGNIYNVFGIDDSTGDVFVVSTLDREQTQLYRLVIEITDTVLKFSSESTLSVQILDKNDNIPTFLNSFYEFSVVENVPLQTEIGKVEAVDKDTGVNKDLSYSIESGNTVNTFSITKDGNLVLIKQLDAETMADFVLTVLAIDKGQPPLTGTTTVIVVVKDFDEFPTQFISGNHYSYTIPEDTPIGTAVFTVQAKDQDRSTLMNYVISNGNDGTFFIDRNTGAIILRRHVDRESVVEYNLTIVADNGVGDTTSTLMTIYVSDVNDNDPFCQSRYLSIKVVEDDAVGTEVGAVNCDDKDLNQNADLVYNIISGNVGNTFRLSNDSIMINNALDVGAITNYILEIEVKDQGIPVRTTSVIVDIDVAPVVRPPKLYQDNVHINISEGSTVGTVIYDVDATLDGAKEGYWNTPGDLEYILLSVQNSDFSVDIFTGEITIISKLDRERLDKYTLRIKCVNKDNRNLFETLTIEVGITDVNDNAPLFSNDVYIFLVDEDDRLNSLVGQVSANDIDINENAQLSYSLLAGEKINTFAVESQTGTITLNDTLNASHQNSYIFSIAAHDNGSSQLSSTTKVIVKVNDINNNKPRFQQSSYSLAVSESVSIGEIIFQLHAVDVDVGLNGQVTYSIQSGNDDMKFSLGHQNGQLVISESLDRETVGRYVLELIAEDGGVPVQTSTTTLSINVTDVNDNKPIFTRSVYDAKVDRFAPIGSTVIKVYAKDLDIDVNSDINYFITEGNDDNYFLANISTGEITIVSPLYLAEDLYQLKIKAADNGFPRQTSTSMLHIAIFPSKLYTGSHFDFSFPENVSVGTHVGTIIPDGIHGQNGQPSYNLIGGDNMQMFSIETNSGIIRTEKLFDRENREEYFLTITIKDNVNNNINYNKLAHVSIDDVNDNTPLFETKYRAVYVVENSPIGLPVTKFNVTDKDINENGNVTLLIDPSDPLANTLFRINNHSFNLELQIVPDYEMVTDFSFKIYAFDGGCPSRTATAEVLVNIIDVKDTKPYDDRPASYFSLECPMNAKRGDRVTTFTPHDFGIFQSLADPVKYTTMNRRGVFDIDGNSGDLYVQNSEYVYEDARYVMWGMVQVQMNDTWTGAAGIIRIDTFIPNNHLFVIEHDVPVSILQAQRNKLRYALQDLFPPENRVGVWKIVGDDDISGKRRLLSIRSKSLMYVVQDRTTDTLEGIDKDKTFMPQDDILKIIQQSDDGTPAYALKSKAFSTFPVTSVSPYYEEPESVPWYNTTLGIVILVIVLTTVILLVMILFLYFYCTRQREKLSDSFVNFPSTTDMLSEDLDGSHYPYSLHPAPFRPWTGSCTSINGTQPDMARRERWQHLLENAEFGFQSLRKPMGKPMPLKDGLEHPNQKLNPWLFKYGNNNELDIQKPHPSLTGYKTIR